MVEGCRKKLKRGSHVENNEPLSQQLKRVGRKSQAQHNKDAMHAYVREISKQDRRIIIGLEADLTHQVEEEEQEVDYEFLVPDLGNSRGRVSQYK